MEKTQMASFRWRTMIRIEQFILHCMPNYGVNYEHRDEVILVSECIESVLFHSNRHQFSLVPRECRPPLTMTLIYRIARSLAGKIIRDFRVKALMDKTVQRDGTRYSLLTGGGASAA